MAFVKPINNLSMFGINLKNLNILKTLNVLNINKKLKSAVSMNTEKIDGMEIIIKIVSNIFQLLLKKEYFSVPIFNINSMIKNNVNAISNMDNICSAL